MLEIGVITVLPDILAALHSGITGRALENGLAKVQCWNPRDWATNAYGQVDDKPYGGGPGMVLMYEPVAEAIKSAKQSLPPSCKTVYLSPQGKRVRQQDINAIVQNNQSLLFIAGRYEGIDERIIQAHVDEEWSIGDFVLSGGELAAMVFIDAILRILPGSLNNEGSAIQDSFMNGLLDCPHYTRPASIDGMDVPEVLLKGNHREIARYRRKQSLGNTWLKRPSLLKRMELSEADAALLDEFKQEQGIT